MRNIAILGSTGSIGTQALQVIDANRSRFSVELLTAHDNWQLLVEQALSYNPNAVVIGNSNHYLAVKEALAGTHTKVFAGKNAIAECMAMGTIDMVISALVGFAGLAPTIAAIKHGKTVALANKETLVVAGELITQLAVDNKTAIIPVDSEHSAIFQCIVGEQSPIEKITLTASGGPFRELSTNELRIVTPKQALAHPNWLMGNKVTIDSATLMNKGFEVIEAKWLFGLHPHQIEVLIHPQSVVHSMVQFEDGSIKAQLGAPDMRIPIQYAISFPERLKSNFPRLSLNLLSKLTFEQPDTQRFPNLALALNAMEQGGNTPCILNAANEIAVRAFLNNQISFYQMSEVVEKTIGSMPYLKKISFEALEQNDTEARTRAELIITKLAR